jgi:hypothetical protein
VPLTQAQLTTLKNHIAANGNTIPAGQPWTGSFVGVAINALPNNSDANVAIAGWYSQVAPGPVWGFRSSVPVQTVIDSIAPAEYLALTGNANTTNLHHNGLDLLLRNGVIRPSPVSTRNWLVALLPAGTAQASRDALLAACTRHLTHFEGLFAVTGTGPGGGGGSAQSQAKVLGVGADGQAVEGELTWPVVAEARNLA